MKKVLTGLPTDKYYKSDPGDVFFRNNARPVIYNRLNNDVYQ